jgi:23S rRNA pseudouridine1911/1915/1917 synthase
MIPLTDEAEGLEFTVGAEDSGVRIDKMLVETLTEDMSRSQLQDWIRDGHVVVNGNAVKPNYKVSEGDIIAVRPPEPEMTELVPEAIPLEVVYEDADVIVVNKRRGMVVHPAVGHPNGTLVNALMYHCKDLSGINGEIRPGIVHRIDKDTSGLLMIAKNDLAHTSLSEQLKEHSVTRRYVAVVHGVVEHEQGTIDAPLGRDPQDRKLFTVTDKGAKHAVTHFAVMEHFAEYTVLDLMLETGRTHQIRVHMKFIGHPLVGDPVYGRSKGRTMNIPGQALHAAVLGFTHPRTGERITFEAPIPQEMQEFIDQLRML